MKNKGFTLIELLAVIVILAIIALIAVPIILNIINDARVDSTKRSAEAYVDAVENSIVNENLKNPSQDFKPDYCSIKENKTTLNCGYGDNQSKDIEVKIDGTLPEEGDINFDENGKIQNGTLVYEEYIADIGNNGVIDNFSERHKSDANWFTFSNNEDGTATVTGFTDEWTNSTDKNKYDIEIPSKTPSGKTVTVIGQTSFPRRQLNSVRIPNTIVTISNAAFPQNNLKNLIIPSSVETIGNTAFASNPISNLKLGNKVKTIDDVAFASNKITSLVIPNSVTSIGANGFTSNQISSLKLGNSLVTIGDNAFSGSQITSLILPDSVTSIGDTAFAGNKMTSLDLGNGVQTIGKSAFVTNNLTSVTIPNSVTTIGDLAFEYNNLTSVTIPNSVTTIGEQAFYKSTDSNPNLTKIINKTGREFDWGDILSLSSQSCVTCTVNGVEITAE